MDPAPFVIAPKYGEPPTFERTLELLRQIEAEINGLVGG
jgi:hypothetical protein